MNDKKSKFSHYTVSVFRSLYAYSVSRDHYVSEHEFPGFYVKTVGFIFNIRKIPRLVKLYHRKAEYIRGSVYTALLPHCEHVYVTKVDACPKADSFFPDLDADPSWRLAWQSRALEENGLRFQFCDYVNLSLE